MATRITYTAARLIACSAVVAAPLALAVPEAKAGQSGAPVELDAAARFDEPDPAAPFTDRASIAQDAASSAGGWWYGGRGALSLLQEDSLGTGIGFSAIAVYPFTTDLEIEGELGVQIMDTESNGLPAGRLLMFPLRGTLRVQMWRFGGVNPYVGGGAGVYFNRFTFDDATRRQLEQLGFGTSASVDASVAIHAAGGLEWQRDNMNFGVDVKYVIGNADTQSAVVDRVTGEVFRDTSSLDLNGLWLSFGVRFRFR